CFQAEDGIRDRNVTGVQTCALPIWPVVDQDSLPAHRLEPVFGVFNALRAPLFDVDVGGDRQLIVKLDPGLCDWLLRCQPQGTEAVIIERRSEEHTSELQSRFDLVCRLLLEPENR